ncbi:hypothetical protein AgCh_024793 [Apium graveolens]
MKTKAATDNKAIPVTPHTKLATSQALFTPPLSLLTLSLLRHVTSVKFLASGNGTFDLVPPKKVVASGEAVTDDVFWNVRP